MLDSQVGLLEGNVRKQVFELPEIFFAVPFAHSIRGRVSMEGNAIPRECKNFFFS